MYGKIVERPRDHYYSYGEVAVEIAGVGVISLPEWAVWRCR
jgi:hypothetical protein